VDIWRRSLINSPEELWDTWEGRVLGCKAVKHIVSVKGYSGSKGLASSSDVPYLLKVKPLLWVLTKLDRECAQGTNEKNVDWFNAHFREWQGKQRNSRSGSILKYITAHTEEWMHEHEFTKGDLSKWPRKA
jgi:hypothetical protein